MMGHEPAFAALPAEEQAQILLLADGSIGRAKLLCDAKERKPHIARREQADALVLALLKTRDSTAKVAQLNLLTAKKDSAASGGKREELLALLCEVQSALRDLILLKRAETVSLGFYTDRDAARELCDSTSVQGLLLLYDRVENTRRQLLRNANVRLALTALLLT